MSSLAVCNMGIVVLLFGFALYFCDSHQHKAVLYGQALVLFLSQLMLASPQGAKIESDQTEAGIVGTFVFIMVAFAGSF